MGHGVYNFVIVAHQIRQAVKYYFDDVGDKSHVKYGKNDPKNIPRYHKLRNIVRNSGLLKVSDVQCLGLSPIYRIIWNRDRLSFTVSTGEKRQKNVRYFATPLRKAKELNPISHKDMYVQEVIFF